MRAVAFFVLDVLDLLFEPGAFGDFRPGLGLDVSDRVQHFT